MRNNPPWSSYVDVLRDCVVNFSSNGEFLVDLSEYIKASIHTDSKRSCGALFLKEVSQLKLSVNKQPTVPMRVCIAIIKAQLSCRAIKVDSGICQQLTRSHVKSLAGTKLASKTLRIEKMMGDARVIVKDAGLNPRVADVIKILGGFDVRLVNFVLGLGKDSVDRKNWPNTLAIGKD